LQFEKANGNVVANCVTKTNNVVHETIVAGWKFFVQNTLITHATSPHPTPCKWLEKLVTYLEVPREQDVDGPPDPSPCKWLEKLAMYLAVLRAQDVNSTPHPTRCKWSEKLVTKLTMVHTK
jgi:hypothetical protein